MKVTFNADFTASYDGVNKRTYKKGQVVEPSHAQEAIVFRNALASGQATLATEIQGQEVKTKVVKPKSKK